MIETLLIIFLVGGIGYVIAGQEGAKSCLSGCFGAVLLGILGIGLLGLILYRLFAG